jgi:VCBS repeat protein
MSPARHLPETLGPDCAFLDYDDGWMDVYLVNSGPCDFYKPDRPVCNALYRNNRDGTFTDITARAGVTGGTFGMGVAVADYDNDGYPERMFASPETGLIFIAPSIQQARRLTSCSRRNAMRSRPNTFFDRLSRDLARSGLG